MPPWSIACFKATKLTFLENLLQGGCPAKNNLSCEIGGMALVIGVFFGFSGFFGIDIVFWHSKFEIFAPASEFLLLYQTFCSFFHKSALVW
jgi:hypothetical protein